MYINIPHATVTALKLLQVPTGDAGQVLLSLIQVADELFSSSVNQMY